MQDNELVELVREGDADALDVLLHRYTSYARAKAKTYFLIGADREDIIQEGMIGLFKAIRDYDPEKTVSFRSFAELCITRQIITAIKGATRQKHAPLNSYVSLHRSYGADDDDGERQLVDFLASARIVDPVEQVVAEDEVARIRQFLAKILSELEVDVLNQYLEGRSYQEIAGSLRRQAKSIDNALQRIKRKLENFLREREAEAEAEAAARAVLRVAHYTPNVHPSADESHPSNGKSLLEIPQLEVLPHRPAKGHRATRAVANGGDGRHTPPEPEEARRTAKRPKATARTGDLRASLRLAAAAAARKGARVGRTAAKKAPRNGRKR